MMQAMDQRLYNSAGVPTMPTGCQGTSAQLSQTPEKLLSYTILQTFTLLYSTVLNISSEIIQC